MEIYNRYVSKCNILFDKNVSYWCSFQPKCGDTVYTCYSCRDMFHHKSTFLDHINRRAVVITYNCKKCTPSKLTFLNPCMFHLHARSHFSKSSGEICLDDITISMLPVEFAGYTPHPQIPLLYDVEEDDVGKTVELNVRCYNPIQETLGKPIVKMKPTILIFHEPVNRNKLMLKQLSSNIPYCQFILLENEEVDIKIEVPDEHETQSDDEGIDENENIDDEICYYSDNDDSDDLPLTIHNKNKEMVIKMPKCPECEEIPNCAMNEHFLSNNRPLDENLKCIVCRFIAPTACSLLAHSRLHHVLPPFICPECGRNFENHDNLLEHLEEVCFHLAKQVRYRCPAKNCGKIFAQTQTFALHFSQHIQLIYTCKSCDEEFTSNQKFIEHCDKESHDSSEVDQMVRCSLCKNNDELLPGVDCKEHINQHCTDRSFLVYVYLCKFCRGYFRSTLTYVTHLLRCSKKQSIEGKSKSNNTIIVCLKCTYPVKFTQNISIASCPRCGATLKRNEDKEDLIIKRSYEEAFDENRTNPPEINEENEDEITDDEVEENVKINHKKKKIKVNNTLIMEKLELEHEQEQNQKQTEQEKDEDQVDEVLLEELKNEGLYLCKICGHTEELRNEFHVHIITHREIPNSYQCMECGECFVVKPTLEKHLRFFHNIIDIDKYFDDNQCFYKEDEAEEEEDSDVEENQCKVCKMQFENLHDLNKHFRIHGMAFLQDKHKQ